jgi:hypothetical protein
MTHPLMQRLWIEFMRAPFSNGHPLWCWYGDTLDAREKKAIYEAFCGLSALIDDHVSREVFLARGESVGTADQTTTLTDEKSSNSAAAQVGKHE